MKRVGAFFVLALLVVMPDVVGQGKDESQTGSFNTWRIYFGTNWPAIGKGETLTVCSDGRITYLNKEQGTTAARRVSASSVAEITELIKQLKVPQTKAKYPDNGPLPWEFGFNPKLSWFNISLGNQDYKIERLDLSVVQLRIYKQLRQKAESLFDNAIKEQAKMQAPPIMRGHVWTVLENYEDTERNALWHGRLTRRGQSFVFDAVWRNAKTGEEVHDTVELLDAVAERVLLRRDGPPKEGLRKFFRGTYSRFNLSKVSGNANADNPSWFWEATIESESSEKPCGRDE